MLRQNSNHALRLGIGLRFLACSCLLMLQTGCNYFILLGYLIGGPPSIEPDFDTQTRKSFTDRDVSVAVVCYAPTELKWDFSEIDNELAKYVTYRLHEHHIKVINPDQIIAWIDKNPDWDRPEEIGEAFNCTYVVYIDLHEYSLYEENSANLYRGRAEGSVSVFEMDEVGHGEKIYSKEIISRYPLTAPKSTTEISYPKFKKLYLSRLSDEIGRIFYEYYNGDDIPHAT
ncbi:MAG: hypothetical protein O2955_10500 [Planctomycetota bacterium]|nr:hypothetical protein [Planctomycetota bacterium]MDA1212940.1 hypothetical protein [Planctomycetota bacterium]